MPGRKYSAIDGYRYGFNGKENDNEVKGEGNNLDFGARIYDPRIGRWFSVDPDFAKSPSESPYIYAKDNPIYFIDPDGNTATPPKEKFYTGVAKPMLQVLQAKGIAREKAFFIIAQVRQEQGWSPKYAEYNIYFNIKGKGTAGSLEFKTHEYEDGVKISTRAGFRKYNTMEESVDDYLSLIKRLYPNAYNALFDSKSTIADFAAGMTNGVGGRKYATDPNYAKNIENAYKTVMGDYGKYVKNDPNAKSESNSFISIYGFNPPWQSYSYNPTDKLINELENKKAMTIRLATDAKKWNMTNAYNSLQSEIQNLDKQISTLKDKKAKESTQQLGPYLKPS